MPWDRQMFYRAFVDDSPIKRTQFQSPGIYDEYIPLLRSERKSQNSINLPEPY